MTYELVCYLFVFFIGVFFCFTQIKSKRLYFFVTLFIFFIYSIVVRYSGFDIDMREYNNALKYDYYSMYYLREPIYWFLSRYIYSLTKSSEITFIFFDVVSFVLVLKSRENLKLPQYYPYLFLLFFPTVMGINNVYRQYLAMTFFIYFISLLMTNTSNIKALLVFFISALTHNMAALFFPIYFLINKKNKKIITLLSGLLILIILPFVLGTKSDSDTGTLGIWVYIFVMLIMFIFLILSFRYKLDRESQVFYYYSIYLLILVSFSGILMGSGQSKRIGMFSLVIMLIPIVKAIELNYIQKKLVRFFIYIMLILPTVLFSSSLNMLLTQHI
ncbi:EpsG family protein [Photobacterium toruni]|uniref:EpsG family protein n=1 Tax=Photobacterium toruni TaxID=1935446 RepID=UPI002110B989|nr:EpsG family protein [Photobacterium toruni]